MAQTKQERNNNRHRFLLETFFLGVDKYATKQVGNFTLVRLFNANVGEWEVAIYSNDAFNRSRDAYLKMKQATLI